MQGQFIDGQNHYGTSTIGLKYASVTNAAITSSGHPGQGNALTTATTGAWNVQPKNILLPDTDTACVGIDLFMASTGGSGIGGVQVVKFNLWEIACVIGSAGDIIMSDVGSDEVTTPSGTFTFNQWSNYIEFKYNRVNGAATIYLNGVQVATGTLGVLEGTTETTISIGNVNGHGDDTLKVQNIYVGDVSLTTGANLCPSPPLGPGQVIQGVPSANGRVDQWTPSAGTNWQNVSDIPPNSSVFNSSATAGNVDDYVLTGLSGSLSAVYLVQTTANIAGATGTGSRTVGIGLGNGATENFTGGIANTVAITPSLPYAMYPNCFSSNPFTSATWVPADLTTAQASIKLEA